MYWELFRSVTGVDMVHVPYRGGGPAVTDLLGEQVLVYFGTFASTIEHARLVSGQIFSHCRNVGQYRCALWRRNGQSTQSACSDMIYVGIAAPHGTPPEIVEQLNKVINLAFADARITGRIADLGDSPLSLSSSDFTKLVIDETKKWRKVIAAANIKAD
jgi:tripartite-type tricarboxylate transporter receptor subunit TctC